MVSSWMPAWNASNGQDENTILQAKTASCTERHNRPRGKAVPGTRATDAIRAETGVNLLGNPGRDLVVNVWEIFNQFGNTVVAIQAQARGLDCRDLSILTNASAAHRV